MACRLLALWILIGLPSRLIIGAGTSTASATSSTLSSVRLLNSMFVMSLDIQSFYVVVNGLKIERKPNERMTKVAGKSRVFNFKDNIKYFECIILNLIRGFLHGTGHINTYFCKF